MDDIQTPPDADPMPPVDANEPAADAPPADVNETLIQKLKAATEAEWERFEQGVERVLHTIEHRSFARASADEPMPVTTHTGN